MPDPPRIAGGLSLLSGLSALLRRRFALARILAGATVALVLVGWGFGLHPWLIARALAIQRAAAPRVTLVLVSWILAAGAVVPSPAFVYL